MPAIDLVRQWYHYNADVRRPYLEVILGLSPDQRLQDRGASYPSLQEIYVHVLDAYLWWFEYVPEDRAPEYVPLNGRDTSPSEIRALTDRVDSVVFGRLDRMTEVDLTREWVCHFPGENAPSEERFPIEDVVWHMVEEELQHRGELNALLWQINVEPPIAGRDDWKKARRT
jgi:uncharacterized damage-inducible protein DinB